jgi:hypothetical protein
MAQPPKPPETTIGKPVKFDGEHVGIVEDDVSLLIGEEDYKAFLQKIRLEGPKQQELGSHAYRWCYYSLSGPDNKRRPNQWVFGQYAQLLSLGQLQKLLKKAHDKGWPV